VFQVHATERPCQQTATRIQRSVHLASLSIAWHEATHGGSAQHNSQQGSAGLSSTKHLMPSHMQLHLSSPAWRAGGRTRAPAPAPAPAPARRRCRCRLHRPEGEPPSRQAPSQPGGCTREAARGTPSVKEDLVCRADPVARRAVGRPQRGCSRTVAVLKPSGGPAWAGSVAAGGAADTGTAAMAGAAEDAGEPPGHSWGDRLDGMLQPASLHGMRRALTCMPREGRVRRSRGCAQDEPCSPGTPQPHTPLMVLRPTPKRWASELDVTVEMSCSVRSVEGMELRRVELYVELYVELSRPAPLCPLRVSTQHMACLHDAYQGSRDTSTARRSA
jgi:hypothetical protein